jgi:subtilisin family serine protease
MKDVEYAFVPPVRRLFARRSKASPDPLTSRLWGHGAIRLGQARAAAGFKNATGITVAVVDSGIDTKHPDLKGVIVEYKNFLRGSDKDFVGHGTHVAGIQGLQRRCAQHNDVTCWSHVTEPDPVRRASLPSG